MTPFRYPITLIIDGQKLTVPAKPAIHLKRQGENWSVIHPFNEEAKYDLPPLKEPGLQGPIDDAFNTPFLHVLPDRPGFHPETDAWVAKESAAQISRWRTLFRGDVRVKKASEVDQYDGARYNLILWGDPASNKIIADTLSQLPIQWTKDTLTANSKTYPTTGHLPALIYPNNRSSRPYIVLNSGPTFREAHSKTNSLQNPKLPDWAILDITSPPTPEAAGKVLDAGFFSETWDWK